MASPTRTLNIVAAQRPPLVMIKGEGLSNDDYTGMLIELLPNMLDAAGITRPFKLYKLPAGGGGSMLANGTWSGVMGELTSGRADMALFPLTSTSARMRYIDATVPFMDTGYALLVEEVSQETTYSFLLPFQRTTWLVLLAALVAVVLALSLLDAATRRARHAAAERYYGRERAQGKRKREQAMEYLTESIFMLMGQGSAPTAKTWSVRILFVCWAVFSIIMLSAYTANLTANLTVSRLDTTLRTLAALKRSGRPFGVPADSSVVRYFRESRDGLAGSLLPAMVEYKNQSDAVAAVRAGKLAAYVSDWPVLRGLAADPPCDLSVTDDTFGPGQLVIGLRKRSPMEGPLSDAMLRLSEGGVLSDLRRKWFVDLSTCASKQRSDATKEAQAQASSLSLAQVYPVFILLAVGMGVAALWAAAESLYFRHAWRHVKEFRTTEGDLGSKVRTLRRSLSDVASRGPSRAQSRASGLGGGPEEDGGGGGGGGFGGDDDAGGRNGAGFGGGDGKPKGGYGGGFGAYARDAATSSRAHAAAAAIAAGYGTRPESFRGLSGSERSGGGGADTADDEEAIRSSSGGGGAGLGRGRGGGGGGGLGGVAGGAPPPEVGWRGGGGGVGPYPSGAGQPPRPSSRGPSPPHAAPQPPAAAASHWAPAAATGVPLGGGRAAGPEDSALFELQQRRPRQQAQLQPQPQQPVGQWWQQPQVQQQPPPQQLPPQQPQVQPQVQLQPQVQQQPQPQVQRWNRDGPRPWPQPPAPPR